MLKNVFHNNFFNKKYLSLTEYTSSKYMHMKNGTNYEGL